MSIQTRILQLIKQDGPMTREQIFTRLKVNENIRKDFKVLLKNMTKDGQLYRDNKKFYHLAEESGLIKGTIQGNEKGFAFLIPDNEELEDIYIHGTKMNSALHGDKVLVKLRDMREGDKRLEGIVDSVLERSTKTIVGVYDDARKFGFVKPDESRMSTDIYVPKKKSLGAKEGQKVVVEIEKYPTPSRKPEGKIIEILGYPDEKGVDVMSIAYALGLPVDFSQETLEEARAIPDTVSANSIKAREDLRGLVTFTIDGADSKDFDDAISVEVMEGNKYRVWIHIADVAEYVRENSYIDREARQRGNSVYLLNKVIPMLPKELSNGICSLNEGVDRLTLSLSVDLDKAGNVLKHQAYEAVIRSNRRLVYTHVSNFLEDQSQVHPSLEGLEEDLLLMRDLAMALKAKRQARGNIDFSFDEPHIELDEEGRPVSITIEDRRIANELIEEFMLLANETIAEEYYKKKLPFLYRIHEEPNMEKLETLNQIIRPFGYHLNLTKDVSPKDIQFITEKIKGKDEEALINTMILRSMQKARYSADLDMHFGLAATFYSHFTSPIRRYSDLTIHRVIKADLNKILNARLKDRYAASFPEIADHVSATEKHAQEAERKVMDVKMAQYMFARIGQEFDAKISGITSFGIFASLDNTIEGLISYTAMEDFYFFDESSYQAVGEKTGNVFKMGDKVRIKVVGADPIKGRIDFSLVGDKDNGQETGQGDLSEKQTSQS